MLKLKFHDFIETYTQHEELAGEVEQNLRAADADDELCQASKDGPDEGHARRRVSTLA